MRGKVGGVVGTTLGAEVCSDDGITLGYGTWDERAMKYFHWPNKSRRSMIALIWANQVAAGASVIAHVMMYMV